MWTVAQLRPLPSAAEIAMANLRRQGYNPFHPSFAVRKVRHHKVHMVQQPLFKNYLFIELRNGQRWTPVNNTLGVLRLLTRKSSVSEWREPCTIGDSFIQQLRRCSFKNGDDNCWCLHPGTRVKILHGALASHTAIVMWSDAERCRLLIEILGRTDVVVTLDASEVAAV
jgi:transcription antitermination factor NusG